MNECGLFRNKHKGMASVKISNLRKCHVTLVWFETEWWCNKATKNGTIFKNFDPWKWEKDTISKRRAPKTKWRGAMLCNNGDFIYFINEFIFIFLQSVPLLLLIQF